MPQNRGTVERVPIDPDRRNQSGPPLTEPCPRTELIEHAMRLVGDELVVWPLRQARPGSSELLGCLGRITAHAPGLLPAGSPLRVWASEGSGQARTTWRDSCAPRPGSLWGELLTLRALVGTDPGAQDPLVELSVLRGRL